MTGLVNINGKPVSTNPNDWYQAVMADFTRGASVSDIATSSGCSRARVEAVIREALAQVCAIVKVLNPKHHKLEPDSEKSHSDNGTGHSEAIQTAHEGK